MASCFRGARVQCAASPVAFCDTLSREESPSGGASASTSASPSTSGCSRLPLPPERVSIARSRRRNGGRLQTLALSEHHSNSSAISSSSSSGVFRGPARTSRLHVTKGAGDDTEYDEEWEKLMLQQTAERDRAREKDKEDELLKEAGYKGIADQLQNVPSDDVKRARKLVASLLKAGEKIEEMIEEAAEHGEITPVVLLVIKGRLDLARHDDERDAIQALDLLYRRIETEIWSKNASPAYQLLNELLNFHDGLSKDEWLRRSRRVMLQVFPPEDAFSMLASSNMDLQNQDGPIDLPPQEEEVLLRIDFIREVNEFLQELQAQPQPEPIQGFDPASVATRFRQEEKLRGIEQVRDLRDLAVQLQW